MIWPRLLSTCSQVSHHVGAEAVDDALAGERHELHVAGLTRLEPNRGAGRDIQPHAAGLLAIELQCRIGFEEMIVRADLDRPIACVSDGKRHRLAAGVEFYLAVLDEEFAGDHFVTSQRCAASCPALCRASTSLQK